MESCPLHRVSKVGGFRVEAKVSSCNLQMTNQIGSTLLHDATAKLTYNTLFYYLKQWQVCHLCYMG